MSSTTSFWRSSGISRMPNARFAVLRSGVTTPCEKYAGTASSRRRTALLAARAEEVRQRQRRAQLGRVAPLRAALAGAVAVLAQHLLLEARHPGDHLRVGDVVGAHGHVDLAGHARSPPGARSRPSAPAGPAGRARARRRRPRSACRARAPPRRPRARSRAPAAARESENPSVAPRAVGAATRPPSLDARSAARSRARARVPPTAPAPRRRQPLLRGRAPAARSAASAAKPAHSAQASASTMPTTSSRPKPRTIGTGERSSTRKPVAVATPAVRIVGPPAVRPPRPAPARLAPPPRRSAPGTGSRSPPRGRSAPAAPRSTPS